MDIRISDTSFDEEMGSAQITIEGRVPTYGEVDDPIVELFRPIRIEYADEIFFTIIVSHRQDIIVCTLLPSNRRGRPQEELSAVAKKALQGDSTDSGIISKYKNILEIFAQDEDGLKVYLEKIEKIKEAADEGTKTILRNEANNQIKAFVAKCGLEMPSQSKKRKQIIQQQLQQ